MGGVNVEKKPHISGVVTKTIIASSVKMGVLLRRKQALVGGTHAATWDKDETEEHPWSEESQNCQCNSHGRWCNRFGADEEDIGV